jgi:hypothetical protein
LRSACFRSGVDRKDLARTRAEAGSFDRRSSYAAGWVPA